MFFLDLPLSFPLFFFQLVPLIPIIPKITSIFCIQDLDLVLNDQIVQPPWEQTP
jgi:hypothetical protein